jgi:hypothetical protein
VVWKVCCSELSCSSAGIPQLFHLFAAMSASGSLALIGRKHERLAQVDEVRIADLILIPAIDDGIAQPVPVRAMANAPEIVTSGNDGRVNLRNEHGPRITSALGKVLLGAELTGDAASCGGAVTEVGGWAGLVTAICTGMGYGTSAQLFTSPETGSTSSSRIR